MTKKKRPLLELSRRVSKGRKTPRQIVSSIKLSLPVPQVKNLLTIP